MSSHLEVVAGQRRVPSQDRGERRVNALLNAAECVIAESGYDAATMSDIAERAGASIGSLYQFFPNKMAITTALRARYGSQFNDLLDGLERYAKSVPLQQLVRLLVDTTIDFVESHPAFLAVLDAPCARTPAPIRTIVRERVAGFFLARRPRMSRAKALWLATVALQIIKGMNQVYGESHSTEKRRCVQEFKTVLYCYLGCRLNEPGGGLQH